MPYGRAAGVLLALTVAGCGGASAKPTAATPGARASAPTDQVAGGTTTGAAATKTKAGRGVADGASGRAGRGGDPATTTPTVTAPSGAPRLAHPVPASFRDSGISPGAPSDDEVRAELQQMYVAQAHARKLSAEAANFAGLLPWVSERKTGERVSVASVFRDYGLGLACGGVLAVTQIGVAHKTAPCGTLIDFTYGGRTLRVPVIDRGPYIVGREWDLTGATAAALNFPGLGTITWRCASC